MRLRKIFLFVIGVFLAPSVWAVPKMTFTGPVDTDDPTYVSKLGKNWWAVCDEGSTTTLKRVTLTARPLEATDKKYRFQVEALGCPNTIVLLGNKDWRWLKEGGIDSAKVTGDQPDQDIIFGDQKISIHDREDGERFRGVYLEINGQARRIFGLNEKIWNLKWAGDLDRDNKIDLLVSFTNVDDDEDSSHPEDKLFLSSYGNDLTPVYTAVKANE